jgi:hypothetical protein
MARPAKRLRTKTAPRMPSLPPDVLCRIFEFSGLPSVATPELLAHLCGGRPPTFSLHLYLEVRLQGSPPLYLRAHDQEEEVLPSSSPPGIQTAWGAELHRRRAGTPLRLLQTLARYLHATAVKFVHEEANFIFTMRRYSGWRHEEQYWVLLTHDPDAYDSRTTSVLYDPEGWTRGLWPVNADAEHLGKAFKCDCDWTLELDVELHGAEERADGAFLPTNPPPVVLGHAMRLSQHRALWQRWVLGGLRLDAAGFVPVSP